MGLPKIDLPLFETQIPSTQKKMKFRPFTVKEEKILLIAKESKDINQVVLSIRQILTNCIDGIDIDSLATFDIEYLLLQIRGKSVSDKIQFKIKDPDTQEQVELTINVDEVAVHFRDNHVKNIKLDEKTMLVMRYPSLNEFRTLFSGETLKDPELLFKTMISCIDQVVQEDSVFKMSDFSEEEVVDFANSLTSIHVDHIKNFFESLPRVRYEAKYVNSAGANKTFVVEGFETFFI